MLLLIMSIMTPITFSRYYSSFHKKIILKVREPSYTVVFNANGGEGSMDNQLFVYGIGQNLNTNQFTKSGYIFKEWNTKSDGSGNPYQDCQIVNNLSIYDNGIVTLYAIYDIDENRDNEAPIISDFSISKSNIEGQIDVLFKGTDNSNENIIYTIKLYNTASDSPIDTITYINSSTDIQSRSFTGHIQNTDTVSYYAKIYATDSSGNSSTELQSSTISIKWRALITYDLIDAYSNNTDTTVLIGSSYSTVIKSDYVDDGGWIIPSSVNITMSGKNIDSSYYALKVYEDSDYDPNEYPDYLEINIPNVSGDIVISAEGEENSTCLRKGTKILLANGLEKNIEDIQYDDLIATYNYDIGKIVYVYPLWIEAEHKTNNYQINYFSDGTILETIGPHGVFSKDANKYVSVENIDDFHVGTKIVKFDENNNIKIVTVAKIEKVNEETEYYHVSANGYTNVIANGILTNDVEMVFANLYEFDDNLVWAEDRNKFLAENDLYDEELLSQYFEKHIYLGFRANESKHVANLGLFNINEYSFVLNKLVKDPPKNSCGNNIWKVTTSDDIYGGEYLEQGSIYTLPLPNRSKNFVSWYNTSENKYYMPGDIVTVFYGMHFEAIYN